MIFSKLWKIFDGEFAVFIVLQFSFFFIYLHVDKTEHVNKKSILIQQINLPTR